MNTLVHQNAEEIKGLFEEDGWEAEEIGTGKVVGRWGALTAQGVGRYAIIASEPVVASWHDLVNREETLWYFTILDHYGDLGIVTAEVFFLPSPEQAAELLERYGLPMTNRLVPVAGEDTR